MTLANQHASMTARVNYFGIIMNIRIAQQVFSASARSNKLASHQRNKIMRFVL